MKFVTAALAALFILILACGGDSESTAAGATSVPAVTSAPAAITMTPSAADISSRSGANESGL